MVPVEAMATGTPVIAFDKGGACETLTRGETGVLFLEHSKEAFEQALLELKKLERHYDPLHARKEAEQYSETKFLRSFTKLVKKELGLEITNHLVKTRA